VCGMLVSIANILGDNYNRSTHPAYLPNRKHVSCQDPTGGHASSRNPSFRLLPCPLTTPLEVAVVVSPPFDENSYIAHAAGRRECLIFDPGFDPDAIVELVERERLEPAAIVLTHGHCDHIAGNSALKQRWPDCP